MPIAVRIARERSLLRVAGLAGQADGLLEPLQREHHAAGQGREDAVHPWGMKPPPAVKLPGWKLSEAMTPMARNGTAVFQITRIDVALGHELGAHQVDRGEEQHQEDGDDQAAGVEQTLRVSSIAKFSLTQETLLT